MVLPIIGPPEIKRTVSCVYPPQASMISLTGIPTGTHTLCGSFTHSPLTVKFFCVIASPFSKAFAMAMALEAFPMMAPASAGNPPYSLCNTSRTKTRSQPIG